MFQIEKRLIGLLIAFSLLIAYLCYRYQSIYPPCCDATSYELMAREYAQFGIVKTASSDVRPYGYPLFLAAIVRVSDALSLSFSLLVFLVQTLLYIVLSIYVSHLIYDSVSPKAGRIILVGLLGNVLIFPALGIALTDGFSVIVQLAIVIILARLFLQQDVTAGSRVSIHFGFLGALSGLAIMVRPGNVHFFLFITVALIVLNYSRPNLRSTSWIALVSGCVGFGALVIPQFISNWIMFDKISILPVYDFSGKQLMWGQQYLKYGTFVTGDGRGVAMPYTSPWAYLADGSLWWYVKNPIVGFATGFAHIFAALDFDHLFTYVHKDAPSYREISFVISQSILFWSAVGWHNIYQSAFLAPRGGYYCSNNRVVRCFFGIAIAYLASWIAVYGAAAVENRYALPVMTLFMPVAIYGIYRTGVKTNRFRTVQFFCLYLLLAGAASWWIASLKESI